MVDVMVSTKNMTKNEWLDFRRYGIGGSDVAVICELNKYKSALQLWMEKTGQLEPEEAGEAAYWGNVMEPIIRNEFANSTGFRVDTINSMLRHPEHTFMLANVDGIVIDKDGRKSIFEAKTASAYKAEQWENDKIPEEYMLQIQHYMAVTGFSSTYIAALIGGNQFIYKRIERDDELINMIIQLEYDFWESVVNNEPPAPDGSESCSNLLCRLYPTADTKSKIILPDEALQLVEQFNDAKEHEKYYTELKDEAANKLKAMLGENETGIINDIIVSWKNLTTNRLDTKAFKEEVPEIYEHYVKPSISRRFTIK
jgi:putative phage-type endonuclease